MKTLVRTVFLATAVTLTGLPAVAQMVVHAVSGTITSIDQPGKRMSVAIEEGSNETFKLKSPSDVNLDFDTELRGDAVDATKFNGVGDFAVIYLYGFGDNRTAVAVKDLGKAGLNKSIGRVADFDKRTRKLVVRKKDGSTEEFQVNDTAVVDTGMGLESGRKYRPRKGANVRVTASVQNGNKTALFIRSRR